MQVETEEQRKARLLAAAGSPPPLQPAPSPAPSPPPLAPPPGPPGSTPSGTKTPPTPAGGAQAPATPAPLGRTEQGGNRPVQPGPYGVVMPQGGKQDVWDFSSPSNVWRSGIQSLAHPKDFVTNLLGGAGGGVPNNYDAQKYLDIAQGQAGDVYSVAMANGRRQQSVGTQPITAQDVTTYGIGAERVAAPGTIAGEEAADLRARQLEAVRGVATSPSAASAQMDANLAKVARAQMGQAAMARGADRATARRDAMLSTGERGMEASSASAALAAQEKAERDRAVLAGLSGVRAGDVATGSVDLNAQEANQRAGLVAAQTNQAADLQAQEINQRAGLTADQANEANRLAAYDAAVRAQLGYLGTGLQATGAGTQAAGVAAGYETGINQAQTQKTGGLINAGGAIIGGLLSDERAKQDIGGVGSAYMASPSLYQEQDDDPYALGGQDFLDWQMPQMKAPEQKGLLQSIISDERVKTETKRLTAADETADLLRSAYGITDDGNPYAGAGPMVHDVTDDTLDDETTDLWMNGLAEPDTTQAPMAEPNADAYALPETPLWDGGYVNEGDTVMSDERAKREVDRMSPGDLVDWAETVPFATGKFKPGVPGTDGGKDYHAFTLAQSLERTGPMGRLMVHERDDGLKEVEYGPLALAIAKAALIKAGQKGGR